MSYENNKNRFFAYAASFAAMKLREVGVEELNGVFVYRASYESLFKEYKRLYNSDVFHDAALRHREEFPRPKKIPRKGIIYFIVTDDLSFCKIGISEEPSKRLIEIQVGCPHKISIHHMILGNTETEKLLHEKYAHLNSLGEWFHVKDELKDYLNSIKNKKDITSSSLKYINGITQYDLLSNKGAIVKTKMGKEGKIFFDSTDIKGKYELFVSKKDSFFVYPHNLTIISYF